MVACKDLRLVCFLIVLVCMGLAPSVSAQAKAEAELAKIQKHYVEGYTSRILPSFQRPLESLDNKFEQVLEKEIRRATREGLLDDVLVTKAHLESIQRGDGLPEASDELPETLKSLRTMYAGQHAALVEKLQVRTRALLEPIDALYENLEKMFTKKGLVKDALRIRKEREVLVTDGLTFLPLPRSVPPVVLGKMPVPKKMAVVPGGLTLENSSFIPFRKLPKGRVHALTQDGLKVKDESPIGLPGADRAVRVFATGHWTHYLNRNGELMGHLRPPEDDNRKIVQVTLGYKTPMFLDEKGRVSFSREITALPKDVDPAGLEDAISVASNFDVAVILFKDGRLLAWNHPQDRRPELIELKKVPQDLTSLWATRSTIIGRQASGRFVVVYSPRDESEFKKELKKGKLKTIDANPFSDVVLGIKENGQVIAMSAGGISPPEVPKDLKKAVQVRTGSEIFAAQLEDGSWQAWGKFTAQSLIDKINNLSGPVLDLSTAGKRVVWLE